MHHRRQKVFGNCSSCLNVVRLGSSSSIQLCGVVEGLSGAKLTLAAWLASCQLQQVAVFRYQSKECEAREPCSTGHESSRSANILSTLALRECVDVTPSRTAADSWSSNQGV